MMRWLLLILALLATHATAETETVVLGLSQDRVRITPNFDGSEILIFGAVKRETPIPTGDPLQVVVTIAGPDRPITIFRKARVAGIWVNARSAELPAAPTFYAVATSASWDNVMSAAADKAHNVSVDLAIRAMGMARGDVASQSFTDAAIRLQQNSGLYKLLEGAVTIEDQTLFRASVNMPANLTEGAYRTRIFLTRGGEVVDLYETEITVGKVGLERWLFNLSRDNAFYYGLLSLLIATIAGWGASTIFRLLRNG
ncbi:TIGR02186 family protein [Pseudoprimorskyibacter insulae]|uniref:Transmembrane protein n=1 Tax=Pseudoprimorskyibacter insulae TaxID=1695997 RepID=A0A2R8AUP4_9RHOB|nr:TIGR02186 family protein [Pseudoprimorskyibacter insulae]SPF79751.1 hypothetical protein PRI8871_01548 [Pseudoprimorskyibacter insulae]